MVSDLEQMQNLLEFKVGGKQTLLRVIKLGFYMPVRICQGSIKGGLKELWQELWIFLFQHEEVQFLENELVNQKQKYQELVNFTESLLSAVRDNDLERQKVRLNSCSQSNNMHLSITFLTWNVLCVFLGAFGQSTSDFKPGQGRGFGEQSPDRPNAQPQEPDGRLGSG